MMALRMVREGGASRRVKMERAVGRAIAGNLREPRFQAQILGAGESGAASVASRIDSLNEMAFRLETPAGHDLLRRLVDRIDLTAAELKAEVSFSHLRPEDDGRLAEFAKVLFAAFQVTAPLRLQRRGSELRVILGGQAAQVPTPDPRLIRTLIEARCRAAAYLGGTESVTVSDLARAEGVDVGDVSRSLQLARPHLVWSPSEHGRPSRAVRPGISGLRGRFERISGNVAP